MKKEEGLTQLRSKIKGMKLDKTQCVILVLVGILLLVIAIPVKKNGEGSIVTATEQEQGQSGAEDSSRDDCKKLETILRKIEGVGEVKVLLTYQDGGEKVVLQDEKSDRSTVEEMDQAGGSRTTDESSKELTTVYEGESPYVTRQIEPKIEGILVVAQGADRTAVKQDIQEAIMALFPVEVNKISIVKMK